MINMEIQSPTVNQCISLLDEISVAVATLGYAIFRNANWTTEESDRFMSEFSQFHGWKIASKYPSPPHWTYIEDHTHTLGLHGVQRTKDQLFVHWHAEQTNLEFPQYGALWQMLEKTGDPDAGKTGFVDNAVLYDLLNEDEKKFAERCHVIMLPFIGEVDPIDILSKMRVNDRGNMFVPFFSDGMVQANFVRPLVEIHPHTGRKCLRFNSHWEEFMRGTELTEGVMAKVVLVDGNPPNPEDSSKADQLLLKSAKRVYLDDSIQTWISWQQGDIILPDLFRMTHGVRGGFSYGERKFRGIWAFNDEQFLPADPKQIETYSSLSAEYCFRL